MMKMIQVYIMMVNRKDKHDQILRKQLHLKEPIMKMICKCLINLDRSIEGKIA